MHKYDIDVQQKTSKNYLKKVKWIGNVAIPSKKFYIDNRKQFYIIYPNYPQAYPRPKISTLF